MSWGRGLEATCPNRDLDFQAAAIPKPLTLLPASKPYFPLTLCQLTDRSELGSKGEVGEGTREGKLLKNCVGLLEGLLAGNPMSLDSRDVGRSAGEGCRSCRVDSARQAQGFLLWGSHALQRH